MHHFPIFLDVAGKAIVLSGGGAAALAKLRLLLKTQAQIHVFASDPAPEIEAWAAAQRLSLHRRPMEAADLTDAALAYAASEDTAEDARVAGLARAQGVLINVVDDLEQSAFITPAIIDRDPVTVAIGTEGAAPVLARAIKRDVEALLPQSLGLLARIGKRFRARAEALPHGRPRRDFWSGFYFGSGPRAAALGVDALEAALERDLARHLAATARPGHVAFAGTGPGDADLLTLRARRALDEADVVIHDARIAPEILDLARREATILAVDPSTPAREIATQLIAHAQSGAQIVRLKAGDAARSGELAAEIEAVGAAGIGITLIPGIAEAAPKVRRSTPARPGKAFKRPAPVFAPAAPADPLLKEHA